MNIEFNLDAVETTEFGVGREGSDDAGFGVVPVDADVRSALLSLAGSDDEQDGGSRRRPGGV